MSFTMGKSVLWFMMKRAANGCISRKMNTKEVNICNATLTDLPLSSHTTTRKEATSTREIFASYAASCNGLAHHPRRYRL